MKNYVILGLLTIWILGLAIAFIAGMVHDFKNKLFDHPIDIKTAKKRLICNAIIIAIGVLMLVFKTNFFDEILSKNSYIPGVFFILTAAVQIILGIFELISSKKHEAEK